MGTAVGGHVFIAQGDVTKLACDAWLLPTDLRLHVTDGWRKSRSLESLCDPRGFLRIDPPDGWLEGRIRAFELELTVAADGEPRVWAVNVASAAEPEWAAESAREWLRAYSRSPRARGEPAYGRSRPLLALPLVGTGEGGAHDIKGEVLRALVSELVVEADALDLDAVLVTRGARALAAAQRAREQVLDDPTRGLPKPWRELPSAAEARAGKLADRIRAGDLVLFLGAGVSRAAGLPSWAELLERLAGEADLDEEERDALGQLNALDVARALATRLGGHERLANLIAKWFTGTHASLAHYLLATLPVREMATTNYDELFEVAAEGVGDPVAMLPYAKVSEQRRWLLKMHGTVSCPKDIVLTRDDYLRYAERRAALAGIVQALLITRHMLFVGFSLSDDNFHRVVHDVRNAIGGPDDRPEPEPFGTALTLEEKPLVDSLWKGDVQFVNVGGDTNERGRRRGGPAGRDLPRSTPRKDLRLERIPPRPVVRRRPDRRRPSAPRGAPPAEGRACRHGGLGRCGGRSRSRALVPDGRSGTGR
jgi:hypothetical protein